MCHLRQIHSNSFLFVTECNALKAMAISHNCRSPIPSLIRCFNMWVESNRWFASLGSLPWLLVKTPASHWRISFWRKGLCNSISLLWCSIRTLFIRQEASPLVPLLPVILIFPSVGWLVRFVSCFRTTGRCLRLCDVPDEGRSQLSLSLLAAGKG